MLRQLIIYYIYIRALCIIIIINFIIYLDRVSLCSPDLP